MRLRCGLYRIALKRLRRFDIRWLIKQGIKFYKIKRAFKSIDGQTYTGPIIAHIFLTNRCNLRCVMCDIPNRKAEYEMTTEDCKYILSQLKELNTSGVSFTGGEPLLRKDIFELIEHSKSCGLDTILVTNGLLLERHLDEIIRVEPTIVDVSLDGSKPEIQDAIRGLKGAFDRTTSGIKSLVKRIEETRTRIDVVISTVISNNNINDLGDILKYCHHLNVSRVILCPVHNFDRKRTGSLVEKIECTYNISDFLLNHKMRSIIDDSDYYLCHMNSVIAGQLPPPGCSSGYTTIFFDWEMNLYPCKAYLELGRPICNLRKTKKNLKEIWYSPEYDKFRRLAKTCQRCFLTVNREFDALFTKRARVSPLSKD